MKKLLSLLSFLLLAGFVQAQEIAEYSATSLMQRVSNADTLYIVNFWATWCGPCVGELHEFDDLVEKYQNQPVKILLVSLDFKEDVPKKLLRFLNKKKLKPEVVWLNETIPNIFIPKIETSWQGSIPATLILNKATNYRSFFEGTITASQIGTLADKQLRLK